MRTVVVARAQREGECGLPGVGPRFYVLYAVALVARRAAAARQEQRGRGALVLLGDRRAQGFEEALHLVRHGQGAVLEAGLAAEALPRAVRDLDARPARRPPRRLRRPRGRKPPPLVDAP